MPLPSIVYPLDLSGVSPDNLVVGEPHTVGLAGNRAFVPANGPFFTRGLVVRKASDGEVLIPRIHYKAVQLFPDATLKTGLEVCSVIIIEDLSLGTEFLIDYQVIGGDYSFAVASIQQMLETIQLDNRPVHWGAIIGKSQYFPPTPHLHDIGDVYGFEYLIVAMEGIRQAIMMGDVLSHEEIYQYINLKDGELSVRINLLGGDLSNHIQNFNNPHNVTKVHVGLGNVENYALATTAQAQAGTINTRYMSPLLTKAAVDVHGNLKNNPHQVTKTQVGLGNVDNFSTATLADALAGTSNTLFLTPFGAKAMIDAALSEYEPPDAPTPPSPLFNVSGSFTVAAGQSHQITFTDASTAGTHPITAWEWAFGNGQTSTQQNPSVQTYNVPSGSHNFTVSLKVTDSQGANRTYQQTITLTTSATVIGPTADFTWSVASQVLKTNASDGSKYYEVTIQLTDASTIGSSAITTRVWNLGFSNEYQGSQLTGNMANPQYKIAVPEGQTFNHSLTLTATDGNALSSSKTRTVAVTVPGPVVGPTANFSRTGNLTVTSPNVHALTFTDTSVPGSATIIAWHWIFGNGQTSSVKNPPTQSYNIPEGTSQNINVSLTVTDANNQQHTRTNTYTLTRNVAPPETDARFTVSGQLSVPEGSNHSITVNDQSTPTPGATIVYWEWTQGSLGEGLVKTGQNPGPFIYTDIPPDGIPRSRMIWLRVRDSNGNWANANRGFDLVKVPATPPTANFTRTITNSTEPNNPSVTVSDASIAGSTNIVEWHWDWGDGTSNTYTTGANRSHTYNLPTGTHSVTITLTVKDANNLTSSKPSTISIQKQAVAGPTADFGAVGTLTLPAGTSPHSLRFSNSSTAGGSPITNYSWSFSDGTPNTASPTSSTTSTIVDVQFTVPDGQSKTVTATLTVTDSLGKTNSRTRTYTITKQAAVLPVADFTHTGNNTVVEPNKPSIVVGNTSTAGTYPITNVTWTWGDGTSNSYSANGGTTHEYNVLPGQTRNYNVTLTVTDSKGNTSSKTVSVTMAVTAATGPTADFTTAVTNTTEPTNPSVTVTDTSTNGSSNIVGWNWNWGDGTSSSGKTPAAKTYNVTVGTHSFTITLTVTDANNRTHVTSKLVNVTKGLSGGGGGGCVALDSWMDMERQASSIQIDDWVDGSTYNPDGIIPRQVRANRVMPQPCLRIVTESGITLIASTTTPMTFPDGVTCKKLPDMLGELVLVDDRGELRWEKVIALEDVGVRDVVLFNVDDQCYFAGEVGDRRIATHNNTGNEVKH